MSNFSKHTEGKIQIDVAQYVPAEVALEVAEQVCTSLSDALTGHGTNRVDSRFESSSVEVLRWGTVVTIQTAVYFDDIAYSQATDGEDD